MNFWQAVRAGFSNYVEFRGRAARSEYWYWSLFVGIVAIAALLFDRTTFHHRHGPFGGVWSIVTFLPGLGVSIRRLHDIDRSGWWILLPCVLIGIFLPVAWFTGWWIPMIALIVVGVVVLFYWFCQPGTAGQNRFGPDPFGADGHIRPGAAD
jgi:uncharacterized membrane protein YhaH (DUF805 family)